MSWSLGHWLNPTGSLPSPEHTAGPTPFAGEKQGQCLHSNTNVRPLIPGIICHVAGMGVTGGQGHVIHQLKPKGQTVQDELHF